MNFQKKNKKKIIYSIILILLGFYFIYNHVIYKPHKTIDKATSEYTGNAPDFLITLKSDNIKPWLNKIVTLKGKVTSKDNFGIILNNSIYCQLKELSNLQSINLEQHLSLKGQIIGYDDLLEELKLNNCIIKNTRDD